MDTLNNINSIIKNSTSNVWRGFSSLWKSSNNKCEDCLKHEIIDKSLLSSQRALKLTEIANRTEVLSLLQSSNWVRIAGLFGAAAVAFGAYGAHALNPRKDIPNDFKAVYETANRYHFFHSLALLGVPLTRRPLLVGSLMITGMCVFCGTCYIYSLTENDKVIRYTPYGGLTLILAWLAMIL